jgi:hypothetical protein
MIRDWLGDEPILKACAFMLLLPLLGVNAYLIFAGAATLAEPSGLFGGVAAIFMLIGAIGLVVQLALMNLARRNARDAGVILLLVGMVLGFPGALIGLLQSGLGVAFLLSPVPGAVLLIYTAWRAARTADRQATAWRSQPPYWR